MRYRLHCIVLGISVLAAPSLLADENSGLYLGAGFGDFSTEFDDIGDVDIDFDEDSDASKIFAGWRFNRVIALQLDYIDFGDSTAASGLFEIESDARGLAPSIVATLPLGGVELFARAGVLFYELEVTADGADLLDDTGTDIVYGGGVGITLLQRLALRAEYEIIEISEIEDAEAVWISAAWRF